MREEAKIVIPRRGWLKAVAAGAAAGTMASRAWSAPTSPSPADARRAIAALYASLSSEQRAEVCFDWDFRVNIKYARKPLWQPDPHGVLLRTHVANAWLITSPRLASPFYSDEQRQLILDVMRTTLRSEWVEKLQQQARDDSGLAWGGDQAMAIFGKPDEGPCQCAVTGFHLTTRANVEPEPLAAFGGGITHGHQPSGFYEKFGHPGNIFWQQGLLANEVYKLLDGRQQRQALLDENLPLFQYGDQIDRTTIVPDTSWDEPRRESDIRFRRPGATAPGISLERLGSEQQRALETLLASMLEPYQQVYQDQVFDCLKQQGGLAACSLAFYAQRDLGLDGVWDNWRLEGPSLVWFFRGSPHVHIWIHVAKDRKAPISSYFG